MLVDCLSVVASYCTPLYIYAHHAYIFATSSLFCGALCRVTMTTFVCLPVVTVVEFLRYRKVIGERLYSETPLNPFTSIGHFTGQGNKTKAHTYLY